MIAAVKVKILFTPQNDHNPTFSLRPTTPYFSKQYLLGFMIPSAFSVSAILCGLMPLARISKIRFTMFAASSSMITTPPRLFRSGERRGFFQPATISMVSLHGFSILILLTQSNHKSALLFSCSAPFQVHTDIIHYTKEKVKHMFTYV